MPKMARVSDIASGICLAHGVPTAWTGAILTGSPTNTDHGLAIARIDDTGNTSCGHHFKITGSSAIHTCDGKLIARHGDAVIVIEGGSGTITGACSPTTEVA